LQLRTNLDEGQVDVFLCGPDRGPGGGVVEAYPQDTMGKRTSGSFLYNGTRSLFEQAGFGYERPKAKNHCVMRKTVPPVEAP